MKKLFRIMSKLSANRFAELHSDWPKLFLGQMPLLEVIEILYASNSILQRCANKMRGIAWTFYGSISQN